MKTISGSYDSEVWIQGNSTLWPMGKMSPVVTPYANKFITVFCETSLKKLTSSEKQDRFFFQYNCVGYKLNLLADDSKLKNCYTFGMFGENSTYIKVKRLKFRINIWLISLFKLG